MGMSEREFMRLADKEQEKQEAIDRVVGNLVISLSSGGLDADDIDKSDLEEIVIKIIKKSKIKRGFRKMSLAQYDDIYQNEI